MSIVADGEDRSAGDCGSAAEGVGGVGDGKRRAGSAPAGDGQSAGAGDDAGECICVSAVYRNGSVAGAEDNGARHVAEGGGDGLKRSAVERERVSGALIAEPVWGVLHLDDSAGDAEWT